MNSLGFLIEIQKILKIGERKKRKHHRRCKIRFVEGKKKTPSWRCKIRFNFENSYLEANEKLKQTILNNSEFMIEIQKFLKIAALFLFDKPIVC